MKKTRKFLKAKKKYIWIAAVAVVLGGAAYGLYYYFVNYTESLVSIKTFTPQGEVPTTSNITVEFSRPIVYKSRLEQEISDELIQFTPPLAGTYKWIYNDTLRFFPSQPFAPATRYTARVTGKVIEEKGVWLFKKRRFEFATAPLRIEGISINAEPLEKDPERSVLKVAVQFNYPVAPKEVKKRLTLLYKAKGEKRLDFDFDSSQAKEAADKSVLFVTEPVERSREDVKLNIVVERGLVSSLGGLPIEKALQEERVILATPVLKFEEAQASQKVDEPTIRVKFSQPVDAKTLERYVDVKPDMKFEVVQEDSSSVSLLGGFEPGKTYKVILKKGLPGKNSFPLEAEITRVIQFADLDPYFAFTHGGAYLPRHGDYNLSLTTVNVPALRVKVDKVFTNNLFYFLKFGLNRSEYYEGGEDYEGEGEGYDSEGGEWSFSQASSFSKQVYSEIVPLPIEKNKKVESLLSLKSFLDTQDEGFYILTVSSEKERWKKISKWLVVTDLGLVAKGSDDRLVTFVHGFSDLGAVPGATVTLLSNNNQEIAKATTDASGVAVIENMGGLRKNFQPALIKAQKGSDISFLQLDQDFTSLTDFDVEGANYLVQGYEAFLYADRELFRPGDTAHLVGYVRGRRMSLPEKFPLTLKISDPLGHKFAERVVTLNDYGSFETDISLPVYAPTGLYQASLELSPQAVVGSYDFRVEDFMPLRTKVALATDKEQYEPNEEMKVDVTAMNLFGPPAVKRRTLLKLELVRSTFEPKKYPEFYFGDSRTLFEPVKEDLGETETDDSGKAAFTYKVPDKLGELAGVPKLTGRVYAQVFEAGGGRTVDARETVEVYPQSQFIGVRTMPAAESKDKKGQARYPFQLVVIDRDEKAVKDVPLGVTFYKREWKTILKKDESGRLRYVSEYEDKEMETQEAVSAEKPQTVFFQPKDFGTYIIEASAGDKILSRVNFSNYGLDVMSTEAGNMATPDKVSLKLDHEIYHVGDMAELRVQAPFTGKLLLTWEGHDLLRHETYDLTGNTTTLSIPVTEEDLPNVYLVGVLIRSAKSLEKNAPAMAVGAVPLMVDPAARKVEVSLQAPETMRSNAPLQVDFQIEGGKGAGNGKAQWTLAAVDEGILQITAYTTPDPLDYFFTKRRLEVSTYDVYADLLPELQGTGIPLKVGGDEGRLKSLNPVSVRRVKPVALWSGLVETDETGHGQVTLQVPEFNGKLRLMAIASQKENFGWADKSVVVRDPVVITPQIPRFVAPGDEFLLPVAVYNGTGQAGKAKVTLETYGDLKILNGNVQTADIPKDKEQYVEFRVQAGPKIGKTEFIVSAQIGAERAESHTEVPLRPVAPSITVSGSGTLKPGAPTTIELPGRFLPGYHKAFVEFSSLPQLEWMGSLQYLLQYPYGCIEQITSKVFPLLYLKDLAARSLPEFFKDTSVDYFVTEGISRIESLQRKDSGFSYWPNSLPERAYTWTSLYACHFLAEAVQKGYNVQQGTLDECEGYLKTVVRADQDYFKLAYSSPQYVLENKVYAALVLTLLGKGDRNHLLYLKEAEGSNLSPFSRYQLAEAFAVMGDKTSASELLPAKRQPVTGTPESGGNFNSPNKSKAIILDALNTLNPESADIPLLIRELTEERGKKGSNGVLGNTQENAYVLLALGKIYSKIPPAKFTGKLSSEGKVLEEFSETGAKWQAPDMAGKKLQASIDGQGIGYYHWRVEGIPEGNYYLEEDKGLKVRRRYLNEKGGPVDAKNVRQGDLLVVEVTIENSDPDQQNFAFVDLLPSGLEIENPRLGARNPMSWMPDPKIDPDYIDLRDDRIVFFARYLSQKPARFYYGVRAVTKGKFVVPSIRGEAMYRPDIQSLASSGEIEIH